MLLLLVEHVGITWFGFQRKGGSSFLWFVVFSPFWCCGFLWGHWSGDRRGSAGRQVCAILRVLGDEIASDKSIP